MSTTVRPFTIEIDDAALDDLQRRLEHVRWPDAELVDDWSQGVPIDVLRPLVDYWRDRYDWRDAEARLNRFDQYSVSIDASAEHDGSDPLDVHVIHQRSPHEDATPLLITHGWPGSVIEFHAVIDRLTNPTDHGGTADDAFHVVAPSLPGFGFSQKPGRPGVGVERIARMWADLMVELGYDRYVAQGGDWGSAVTAHVGAGDPDHCAAVHVTLTMQAGPRGEPTEPDELHAIERIQEYFAWDSGYSTQQKTRPQTIGYALADSPVGQLAWILEKFWSWTDHRHVPDEVFDVIDRDVVLDNVMIYWLTNSATSSARLYWESFGSVERRPVEVPSGFSVYPCEIVPPVRSWLGELFTDIVYWATPERGGHFAALEVPEAFVDDLRAWRRAVADHAPSS